MRKYSDREKKVLKELSKISFSETEFFSFFLQKKYFTTESNKALFVFPTLQKAFLYLKNETFIDVNARKIELGEFLEIISLINYLKENRYITIYKNEELANSTLLIMKSEFDNPIDDGNGKFSLNESNYLFTNDASKIYDAENNVTYQALDLGPEIFEEIKNNFFGLLYVSEELLQLVNNRFVTDEEIKFKKQQKATWIGIIVSIILGLFSVIYSIWTGYEQTSQIEKIIDNQNKKVDSINSTLKSINQKLQLPKIK